MSIDRYLRVKTISEITGLSRATIYGLEKAGKFPGKVAIGARAVAWRESAITKWMEERETAVKTGREARPGRPPTSRKSREPKDVSPANVASNVEGEQRTPVVVAPKPSEGFSEAQDDGWGQSGTHPSEEEMAAVRAKLARGAKQSLGTRNRSGSATGASESATIQGKGTRGKVTVLGGSSLRRKTP
jgi:prophage regulatory protein